MSVIQGFDCEPGKCTGGTSKEETIKIGYSQDIFS